MAKTATVIVVPPETWGAKTKLARSGKILVVNADYFTLTCRKDPNVAFWGPDQTIQVTQKSIIPDDITHLWIAKFTSDQPRENLLTQAKDRGIIVWDCVVGELRRRLLPFWAEPHNRHLSDPVTPEDEEETSSNRNHLLSNDDDKQELELNLHRVSLSKVLSRSLKRNSLEDPDEDDDESSLILRTAWKKRKPLTPEDRRKSYRLKLLKKAHERFKQRQLNPTAKLPPRKKRKVMIQRPTAGEPSSLNQALSKLPLFDCAVFTLRYGLGDHQQALSVSEVAKECGIPVGNVEQLLVRVWKKLPQLGFSGDERSLLELIQKQG